MRRCYRRATEEELRSDGCRLCARSAGGLGTFSLRCFALYVSEALHLPLLAQVGAMEGLYLFCCVGNATYFDCLALQLPNAMFVFVFEGALFALTYNGDRFVLFTLLPRRKPRTERCSCLVVPWIVALATQHTGLNLTSSRLLRFACPADGWPGFLLHRGLGRPSAVLVKGAGGLLPSASLRSVPRLSARVFVFGWRGCRRAVSVFVCVGFCGGARPFGPRSLRLRFSQRCAHRCRTRCSRACSRAHRTR